MLLQATEPVVGGYGAALLQAFLALGAICLLAWVVLRMLSTRRFGWASRVGHVRVLERVPLDPRRSLYLVRIGSRVLLLGCGDGSAPALLAEVDPDEVPTPHEDAAVETLLRRFGVGKPASTAVDSLDHEPHRSEDGPVASD